MYGMTETKINKAIYKIKCNKAFMSSHGIYLDDKIIPFKDFVSNSYINSDRYIAELQHRAWSIYEYAQRKDLSNVFLTLTLPSEYHPMKQKSKTNKTLVFNRKYGGREYITKIVNPLTGEILKLLNTKENIEKYQPRGASKELSSLLRKLQNEPSYRKILKDDRCYFRVTEPHKDGTPHLHISFFMPKKNIDSFVNSINRLFPAPQSKIVLDVDSPVHYLMKYILKTLDDLREDNDNVTALSLWYVYHGISRFYTSRTFLSLEIYRKLKGMFSLNELKESYDNEDLLIHFNTQTNELAKIENEFSVLYTPKPILGSFSNHQWREDMENEDNTYFNYEYEPIKFVHKKPMITELIAKDGTRYILNNGLFKEIVKQPYQMGNYELARHFDTLDINTMNPARYAVTRNLMIDRGLIVGERMKPSDSYEAVEVF